LLLQLRQERPEEIQARLLEFLLILVGPRDAPDRVQLVKDRRSDESQARLGRRGPRAVRLPAPEHVQGFGGRPRLDEAALEELGLGGALARHGAGFPLAAEGETCPGIADLGRMERERPRTAAEYH